MRRPRVHAVGRTREDADVHGDAYRMVFFRPAGRPVSPETLNIVTPTAGAASGPAARIGQADRRHSGTAGAPSDPAARRQARATIAGAPAVYAAARRHAASVAAGLPLVPPTRGEANKEAVAGVAGPVDEEQGAIDETGNEDTATGGCRARAPGAGATCRAD